MWSLVLYNYIQCRVLCWVCLLNAQLLRCKLYLQHLYFPDRWDDLHYPLSNSLQDGFIHDIWNGNGVKPLTQDGGFLTYPEHLGLSLSTDGVPVFKSSSDSLWPVYLNIYNLPPSIRTNSENTLLCGLWFGPQKPAIKALLQPVVKMLQSLYTVGLTVKVRSGAKTIRAILLNAVFDLVAKAPILNMKQFNGMYGCLVCTHPGTTVSRSTRVYLPNIDPPPIARTHASVMQAATEAEAGNITVRGIKGISVLAFSLDLVDGIPVDYMHSVLEGVTRWLLHAWFKSENHREAFYLGQSTSHIDDLLLKQRPPSEFSRPPRSIRKHLNYWKASELRTWLLFYSLPLLVEYLPALYFHHYALLVCAIHILLQDCMTAAQIDAAETMLCDFVALLPELYGEKSCTANSHLLTHLPKYVRLWGPLWTHSGFGFESKNGRIKHLFHSRSNIVDQLFFNIDVQQTLQLLHPVLQQESAEFLSFYSGTSPRRGMQSCGEGMYAVGSFDKTRLSVVNRELLGNTQTRTFTRAFIKGALYHSAAYAKAAQGKRNNQVCHFKDQHGHRFGVIQVFALIPEPVAIMNVLCLSDSTILQRAGHPCRPLLSEYRDVDFMSSFLHEVECQNSHPEVIHLKYINGKAVQIELHNGRYNYVLKQPNTYEHN